jgi:hypothetical protein
MDNHPEEPNQPIPDEPSDKPISKSGGSKGLVQFFRESPLVGMELDLERNKDEGRDIDDL